MGSRRGRGLRPEGIPEGIALRIALCIPEGIPEGIALRIALRIPEGIPEGIGRRRSAADRPAFLALSRACGWRVLMVNKKSVGRAWAMPTSSETFGVAPVASKTQAAESRVG